jgi:DNA-binding GntR family transcriptional regulator
LRKAVEISAVRLSIERAQPDAIGALRSFLNETGPEPGKRSTAELIALDETFHEQLMMMSGNAEMLRVLRNVNARIQFVRWIDMERDSASRRPATQREHRLILDALEAHDEKTCVERLERHITRRLDQITSAIASSLSQIYLRHGQF